MKQANELVKLSEIELNDQLTDLKKELFNLRFQQKRTDPFNRDYYWCAGEFAMDDDPDGDDWAVDHGYVSITPIKKEYFHSAGIEVLKRLIKL